MSLKLEIDELGSPVKRQRLQAENSLFGAAGRLLVLK
jgi:hypothetical protein